MKKISIVIISILFVVCIGVNAWYLYIDNYGPKRVIAYTYNVGEQVIKTDEGNVLDSRCVFDINYYSNEAKNGVELFELKVNYFTDEEQQNFYSQGVQFVGNSIKPDVVYTPHGTKQLYKETSPGAWFFGYNEQYYNQFVTFNLGNMSSYYYMSADDFETTFNSTNAINENSKFKIQIDETQKYLIEIKGKNSTYEPDFFIKQEKGKDYLAHCFSVYQEYYDYYAYQDWNYMYALLYDMVQTVANGMHHKAWVEFSDMFNFYEFKDGFYEDTALSSDKVSLIKTNLSSYFVVNINKSASGARIAQDSMFNCIAGDINYSNGKFDEETITSDYFIGRSCIRVNEYDFDIVKIDKEKVALKLSDNFLNYFLKYADKIVLDIEIDIDNLSENGYSFMGLTADNNLDQFSIYRCRSKQEVNNEIIYSEVIYA